MSGVLSSLPSELYVYIRVRDLMIVPSARLTITWTYVDCPATEILCHNRQVWRTKCTKNNFALHFPTRTSKIALATFEWREKKNCLRVAQRWMQIWLIFKTLLNIKVSNSLLKYYIENQRRFNASNIQLIVPQKCRFMHIEHLH